MSMTLWIAEKWARGDVASKGAQAEETCRTIVTKIEYWCLQLHLSQHLNDDMIVMY